MRFIVILAFTSGFSVNAIIAQYYTYSEPKSQLESGNALYYGDYLHGQSTAMGEIYNKYELTCSHPFHPKGTLLKVTRIDSGKSVTVRVNDKGSFVDGVIILLSHAAAMQLELIKTGKAAVTLEVVGFSNLNPTNNQNQETLTSKVPAQNNTQQYDKPIPLQSYQSYEQLTQKGGNGATFKWNTSASPTEIAAGNSVPSNYYDTNLTAKSGSINSGYGIQIGSYGVYDNANRQAVTLQNAGISNVFVKQSIGTNGNTLFRVMVGSFVSRNDAQDYLQSLRNQLIADGIVVDLKK